MLAVRQHSLAGSLALLFLLGCDRSEPLAPEIQAAATAGSGSTLNAPSGTNAVGVSHNRIDIGWQDNSSNETGFEVHRSTSGASGEFTLLSTTGAGVTSYSDGGLTPLTAYCYKVRAFRTTGSKKSYSAFSSAACATTPASPVPAAPSGVDAAARLGYAFDVSWSDNSTNETEFRVERSATAAAPWTAVGPASANVTSLADYQYPGDEQPVCYRVFAVNSFGDSGPSNVDCTASPAAPTNLAGTPAGSSAADLAWTDNSAVEDGFEVRRAGGGADWSTVATLPANATGYRDTGLTPDNTYWYLVRATKDGGSSSNSNLVQVVLATTPPAAPISLDVVPQSSSSVYGMWLDQSTNEAGFRVERSADGGASWVTAVTTGINEYYLTDQGLSAEQQVCYRVIAFNSDGESAPSNADCTTPPAGPSDLVVTGVDGRTVDLAWTDNSAVEDGYEVWLDDGYGSQYSIASLGPNTTTFRYQDSFDGSAYFVVAVKDGGYSDYSNLAYPTPPPGSSSVRAGSTSRAPTPRRPIGKRGLP